MDEAKQMKALDDAWRAASYGVKIAWLGEVVDWYIKELQSCIGELAPFAWRVGPANGYRGAR